MSILNLKAIEHFLVVIVVAFASQVAISGQPVDLTSSAGRSAALTAVVMALWRILREDGTGTAPTTGSTTGA